MPPNVYKWWADQTHIPSMQQFAFDLLSVPAMSAEAERVFSEPSSILATIGIDLAVEALECENRWMKAGLVILGVIVKSICCCLQLCQINRQAK